jgi:hypothetical protein
MACGLIGVGVDRRPSASVQAKAGRLSAAELAAGAQEALKKVTDMTDEIFHTDFLDQPPRRHQRRGEECP